MKLVTPRLVLRDFLAEDLGEYLSVQEDPRFAEFYGPEEGGPDFRRGLLDRFLSWSAAQPRLNYQLAILWKDQVIGRRSGGSTRNIC